MQIEKTCPICGKKYMVDKLRFEKHKRQQTCSRKCSYELISIKNSKSSEYECPVCTKKFMRAPSLIKSKHGYIFCSQKCQYKGRTLGLTKRIVEKPYQYTEESKQRLIAASSKPKGRRVFHWKNCTNCGKLYEDLGNYNRKSKTGMYFCSQNCCNAYRVGDKNPAWRGGYTTYYGKNWRPLQREARKRDKYTCQRCGKLQKDIGKRLDVHHIIPVSAFDDVNDSNTIGNVVSMCHSCHMYTEWHGMDFLCSTCSSYHLMLI